MRVSERRNMDQTALTHGGVSRVTGGSASVTESFTQHCHLRTLGMMIAPTLQVIECEAPGKRPVPVWRTRWIRRNGSPVDSPKNPGGGSTGFSPCWFRTASGCPRNGHLMEA
jgi:hypothetical protein